MDGFKQRLRDSVQLRLSLWLSLTILAIAVVAGLFSFVAAFDEANELQDDVLHQVAAVFGRYQFHAPVAETGSQWRQGGNDESGVRVQFLAGAVAPSAGKADLRTVLPLDPSLPDGMHSLQLQGEPYRVLVKTLGSGERLAVMQETGVRDEIARSSALHTVMPFLLLVPILLLIVAVLVRKMFRPISSLAAGIDRRGDQDLHPVAHDRLPAEVQPFVTAINRLLDRVARAMDAQRRFVADAAHELRTPLTALSLQAERLAQADMSEAAREQLKVLRQGIERGRGLLEQLLSLARAQLVPAAPQSLVSVQRIYRRVLEDLMPLAEARQVDVGVEGDDDAELRVHEMDLRTLVKNLVDNAIRYTPGGGRVDLSVHTAGGRAVLLVRDSGPGIPQSEWQRVFDPFYRVLGSDDMGSGLGLSIVKTIADRMGADVRLSHADAAARTGLEVRVSIPTAVVGKT
ncbi:MAG: ATP-binding protein, partial [Thermomicrobiales bacterium]